MKPSRASRVQPFQAQPFPAQPSPVQPQTQSLDSARPAEKSGYHHGDLRQSLINAAIELIQAGDTSQLSLREVARRVGVSHNAPYRHFQDKEALLSAVAEQGFRGLYQATEQALVGLPTDAAQRLSAIGAAYVLFAVQHPVYYRVMFSLEGNRQDVGLQAAIEQSSGVLFTVIQSGQAAGTFRDGDPDLMAQVAWAFVHGIAMLAIEGQLPVAQNGSLDQFLQASSQLLIQGFAAGDSAKREAGNSQ
ncbi:MAG: TetR/AcrR family transcriptional regulator [Elainella sp.]